MASHASTPDGVETFFDLPADQSSASPQPSSPTLSQVSDDSDDSDPPASFSFPTLQLDGSPDALRLLQSPPRRFSTPPAALSSLGARAFMASRDYATSLSAFADSQYDIVQHEELSDRDNDADTASIASTSDEHSEDDGELVEVQAVHRACDTDTDQVALDELMDNIDDTLETLRQSTVATFRPQLTDNLNRTASTTCVWGDSADEDEAAVKTNTKEEAKVLLDKIPETTKSRTAQTSSLPSLKVILTVVSLLIFTGIQLFRYLASSTALAEHAINKQILAASLGTVSNMSDSTKVFVLDHLLPAPELTTSEVWGMTYHTYRTQQDVRFQAFSPNHFVVSIPASSQFFTPRLETVDVHRSGSKLASNWSELATGVYHIIFDVEQAYGLVTMDMEMKHSVPKSSASHHFGRRMLQRHTYEKATTDLSRTVGERGLVARKTAQTITEKLHHRLAVGAVKSHAIAKQLTKSMVHDLQAVTNITMTTLDEAQRAGRDLIATEQKHLILVGKSIKNIITTQVAQASLPARKIIKHRLRVAIDRTVALRERLYHALDRTPSKKVSAPHRKPRPVLRKAERPPVKTGRKAKRDARKKAKAAAREGKQAEEGVPETLGA
nr:hypothetical protein CFP56_02877 [Quercus suber]